MLPKTGIYALPDWKVQVFLKIILDYFNKI
jgi:hypothetical protein